MTNIDEDVQNFNDALRRVGEALLDELVQKNTDYNGAYRKLRQFCKEKYGDATIPYVLHTYEKQLRIDAGDGAADGMLDRTGYALLEYVCWLRDDQPTPEETA